MSERNEWRPIEEAPRDGTVFLAFADGSVGLAWRFDLDNPHGSWHEWRMVSEGCDFESYRADPTHWMPLPDPPPPPKHSIKFEQWRDEPSVGH